MSSLEWAFRYTASFAFAMSVIGPSWSPAQSRDLSRTSRPLASGTVSGARFDTSGGRPREGSLPATLGRGRNPGRAWRGGIRMHRSAGPGNGPAVKFQLRPLSAMQRNARPIQHRANTVDRDGTLNLADGPAVLSEDRFTHPMY